jgi:hypothetical protein
MLARRLGSVGSLAWTATRDGRAKNALQKTTFQSEKSAFPTWKRITSPLASMLLNRVQFLMGNDTNF